ncbi:hypothetical protein HPB48_013953 [Haemaphysalis longicornis]|uniref:Methyltransferase type 11 domain-containing protein n=1 Tax=Haemaphysalis longicornis TaxID=44386 RepID=A0A9J6GYF1_HAELO|nr:hypothetical protein HPB48_013953 [Haemaphysalis longicornis]
MEVSSLQTSKGPPLSSAQGATVKPMLEPERYMSGNDLQRRHNLSILDFCQSTFLQNTDDTTQIPDIGSGTGDFTRDCLLPRCLPCSRIIGVDCSWDMVEYARRHSNHEKLQYHLLDIDSDVTDFVRRHGRFGRVYSFYYLHWLKDPAIALKNIAELLTHDGECLLAFSACHWPGAVWTLLKAKLFRPSSIRPSHQQILKCERLWRGRKEPTSRCWECVHQPKKATPLRARS